MYVPLCFLVVCFALALSYDTSQLTVTKRFYTKWRSKDPTNPIGKLPLETIPSFLDERVKTIDENLEFKRLPGLAQRAFLWDAGYISIGGGAFQQIWVPCAEGKGRKDGNEEKKHSFHEAHRAQGALTMDSINLPLQAFESTSCTTIHCGDKHYRQDVSKTECTDTLLALHLPALKCGIHMEANHEGAYIRSNNTAIWTTESKKKAKTKGTKLTSPLPAPRVILHPSKHRGYIPVIHLERDIMQQNFMPERYTNCPTQPDATIPCSPIYEENSYQSRTEGEKEPVQEEKQTEVPIGTKKWCRPKMSKVMTRWLVKVKNRRSKEEEDENDEREKQEAALYLRNKEKTAKAENYGKHKEGETTAERETNTDRKIERDGHGENDRDGETDAENDVSSVYIPSLSMNLDLEGNHPNMEGKTGRSHEHCNGNGNERDNTHSKSSTRNELEFLTHDKPNKYVISLFPTLLGILLVASIIGSIVYIRRKKLKEENQKNSRHLQARPNDIDEYSNTMYHPKGSFDISGQTFASTPVQKRENESISYTESNR